MRLECTESQRDRVHGFAGTLVSHHRFVVQVQIADGVDVQVEVLLRAAQGPATEDAIRAVGDEVSSWIEGL